MPTFAKLDGLSLSRPDGERLFSDLSLTVGADRVGLVGRNGCGKSSLLRLLAGDEVPHVGGVSVPGTARRVAQELEPAHRTVAETLGVAGALGVLARLATGEGSVDDVAEADWTLESRLSDALGEVGLDGLGLDRPTDGLSGGERMRLLIARALLDRPDLLLLDEPTNNMDEAGQAAVYELMANWRGGLVVASHDRALLERVDRIVELTPQGVHVTAGGWSAHARARAARLDRAEARRDRAETKLVEVADAARDRAEKQARRDAKGRRLRKSGSQTKILMDAQKERAEGTSGSGRRLAERQGAEAQAELESVKAEIERLRPMSFSLPPCGLPSSRQVLSVQGLLVHHPGGPTIGPVSFSITGAGRVALAGPNGAGKTTILRSVAAGGQGAEGQVFLARAEPPVLDQHLSLLDDDRTLLENMAILQPGLTHNAAHATLARFAFRNTDAERRAGSLSGGERLRAALACVFAADPAPELLILDEPTNHLDLDSLEELEAALVAFDGALLVVSHDEGFLDRIGIEDRVVLPGPTRTSGTSESRS